MILPTTTSGSESQVREGPTVVLDALPVLQRQDVPASGYRVAQDLQTEELQTVRRLKDVYGYPPWSPR